MFKSANDYERGRLVRSVTENRKNSWGVDPTAFDEDGERTKLVDRKKNLETKISQLKTQIAAAKSRAYHTGKRVESVHYNRWLADQQVYLKEIREIDGRLTTLRTERVQRLQKMDDRFERVFVEMAKELLASDVYERILYATIHRVGENVQQ